jgi:isoleucyl-tRNA synthetase
LDDSNIAVEGNMIAKLDLQITPELEREGVARELSRFLNQMRKDADFAVEDKVNMIYSNASENLKTIISEF